MIDLDRKLIAEMAIVLGVCVGAWVMLVRPKTAELHELEASIAIAESDPARERHASIERIASEMNEVRERVREIDRLSRVSRDASRMYGLIMDMAKTHRVNVQALDPGASRTSDDGQSRFDVARFDMRVDGRFEDVAGFVDGITQIEGFVRPGSLSLTPRRGSGEIVDAQFSCETVSFALPEGVLGMVEATDADE